MDLPVIIVELFGFFLLNFFSFGGVVMEDKKEFKANENANDNDTREDPFIHGNNCPFVPKSEEVDADDDKSNPE